jgi:PEP-CTERM motif
MRRLLQSGAVLAILLLTGAARMEAQTLDQSNVGPSGLFGSAFQWQGQTFRPTANTVAGGGFNLSAQFTTSGTLSIQLWDQLASNPGATMIASGSTAFSIAGGTEAMFDVFWSAVTVNPGQEYFLAVNAGTSDINTTFSLNTYASGQGYYNFDLTDPRSPYTCCGPTYDLGFEEYSSNAVAAPEPASIALLATGLFGIAGVARRKRTK